MFHKKSLKETIYDAILFLFRSQLIKLNSVPAGTGAPPQRNINSTDQQVYGQMNGHANNTSIIAHHPHSSPMFR